MILKFYMSLEISEKKKSLMKFTINYIAYKKQNHLMYIGMIKIAHNNM